MQANFDANGSSNIDGSGMGSGTSESNIASISDFLRKGESKKTRRHLGLEIEHFVVDAKTLALVPYRAYPSKADDASSANRPGVEDILKALSPIYDGQIVTNDIDGNECIIGLQRDGAPLSIEPGAQLEISIGPTCSVDELRQRYERFRSETDTLLDGMGYKLITLGYHPTACASEIPLIPKHRYSMMNEYFETSGKHGICMMRASASTQVSIDFTDERDCVDKMRIATEIGPLLYFLCDNSPIFEGELVGALSDDAVAMSRTGLAIPHRMARTEVWNDVDPARSMTADFLFEPDAGYKAYARMLMGRPPILTLDDPSDDNTAVYHGSQTAEEIYAGKLLTTAEVEHILSMFFFDVRLKQYIEIRMPDSMPIEFALSFAALVKGIFYCDASLDTLRSMLADVKCEDIPAAKAALERDGYDAIVYGRPADAWLDELMKLAKEGLESKDSETQDDCGCPPVDETRFIEPLAGLVVNRTTLMDHYHVG